MLQTIEQIPKIGHILLPSIQGDNLNLLELNLFVDDVKDNFDSKCDSVQLFPDITISHLLFADDMILLSTSVNGMQNSEVFR